MFARADMITNCPHGGLVHFGHFLRWETFLAEKLVNGLGIFGAEKFSLGIGPEIFLRAGHIDRTRRAQSDQFMLIDRTGIFVRVVLFVVRTKPMWKGSV